MATSPDVLGITPEEAVAEATGAYDMAHNLLGSVFGIGWDQLFTSGAPTGSSWTALFQMFGYMNSVVMMGVSVMIFYVLSMGVIGTAHEGKALGQRYSTLWTPLRSVFSISMLMPVPALQGISMLQAALLLMVSVGSLGANKMWSMALDYMGDNKGSLVSSLPVGAIAGMNSVAKTIISAEMTQVYFSVDHSTGLSTLSSPAYGFVWNANEEGGGGNYVITFSAPTDHPSLIGKMGSITLPCEDFGSAICNAKLDALESGISRLFLEATTMVLLESVPDKLAMNEFLRDYKTSVDAVVKTVVDNDTEHQALIDAFILKSKTDGWISAGGWHWTIAGLQERAGAEVANFPTGIPVDEGAIEAIALEDHNKLNVILKGYMQNSAILMDDQALAKALVAPDINDKTEPSSLWETVSGWVGSFGGSGYINDYIKALTTGDPISNLKAYGDTLINYTATTFAVASGVTALAQITDVTGTAASIAFGVLGSFLLPLFTLGLTLAYYLPAIPYMIWTMAVLGWFILILESLVAAPIWAAAHAMPEGEGMAGQHGKQGYMLFMNVLLRPSLMVFGFVATFSGMKVIAWLIGTTFETYVGGATATISIGPITTLVMIFIGTALLIQAAHRVFGLVTYLPDNVMRWVGGHGSQLGEAQDATAAKTAMAAGVGAGMSSVGGAASRAGAAPAAMRNAKDKQDQKDRLSEPSSNEEDHDIGSISKGDGDNGDGKDL